MGGVVEGAGLRAAEGEQVPVLGPALMTWPVRLQQEALGWQTESCVQGVEKQEEVAWDSPAAVSWSRLALLEL